MLKRKGSVIKARMLVCVNSSYLCAFPLKINCIWNLCTETTSNASIINVFNKSKSLQKVVPFPFQNVRQKESTHKSFIVCVECSKTLSAVKPWAHSCSLHRNGWLVEYFLTCHSKMFIYFEASPLVVNGWKIQNLVTLYDLWAERRSLTKSDAKRGLGFKGLIL